jgi:hypothetical protein
MIQVDGIIEDLVPDPGVGLSGNVPVMDVKNEGTVQHSNTRCEDGPDYKCD